MRNLASGSSRRSRYRAVPNYSRPIFIALEILVLVCVAWLAFVVAFSHRPYDGIADGTRYLASGENLIAHGESYPIVSDGLVKKTYPYPSRAVSSLYWVACSSCWSAA